MAELREKLPLSLDNKRKFLRPVAYMSTQYPKQTATEVFKQRLQNSSPSSITKLSKHKANCRNVLKPSSILCPDARDLDHSSSSVSWPVATNSSELTAAVSMESFELQKEQSCVSFRGRVPLKGPTISQHVKLQLTEDDTQEEDCEKKYCKGKRVVNVGKTNISDAFELRGHHRTLRRGLRNLKNTCYFNAVMQCLFGCTMLRDLITKPTQTNLEENRFNQKMQVLFSEMTDIAAQEPWVPQSIFKEICTWDNFGNDEHKTQEDAGELLCCLIEKLNEENEPAANLFQADQQCVTECKGCGAQTGVEETFTILTLDIEDRHTQTITSIPKLLDKYSMWENLSTGNEYDCQTCRKFQPANRKTELVYGPKILLMQLNRFTKKEINGLTTTSKLNTRVDFDEELKLPCTLSLLGVTSQYQLTGVIEHRGLTASNGHYVAYVRQGSQWIECDDETATPISWEVVARKQAYILFWEIIEEGSTNQPLVNRKIESLNKIETQFEDIFMEPKVKMRLESNKKVNHHIINACPPTGDNAGSFHANPCTIHSSTLHEVSGTSAFLNYDEKDETLSRIKISQDVSSNGGKEMEALYFLSNLYGGGKRKRPNSDSDFSPNEDKKKPEEKTDETNKFQKTER